jgi:leucyl-tRNA synthetase
LEIIPVVDPKNPEIDLYNLKEAFEAEGVLINSERFDGMGNTVAIKEIIKYLEEQKIGNESINSGFETG